MTPGSAQGSIVTRGDTETDVSAALAVEKAATALLQMRYSDWPTVGIKSVANVSTTTAVSCNVAETQAGHNTGYETEESDEGASEGNLCGPEKHAEGEETCFMSDNEKSVTPVQVKKEECLDLMDAKRWLQRR